MTTTLARPITVPDPHLSTTILASNGTWWLYGYRGHDLTARFTVILDEQFGPEHIHTVALRNADWPTTWRFLGGICKPAYIETTLRSVLPPVTYGS